MIETRTRSEQAGASLGPKVTDCSTNESSVAQLEVWEKGDDTPSHCFYKTWAQNRVEEPLLNWRQQNVPKRPTMTSPTAKFHLQSNPQR